MSLNFILHKDLFTPEECHSFYKHLQREVPWRQDQITIYGKTHNIPRLQQWYGDSNREYKWSNIHLIPLPWDTQILRIRERVQEKAQREFNSVLLNYYRDGRDTVGWHSDNEPELGVEPFIANASFGTMRDLLFRHKITGEKHSFSVPNGSAYFMWGDTQEDWDHCLPKRLKVKEGRIGLAFRYVLC